VIRTEGLNSDPAAMPQGVALSLLVVLPLGLLLPGSGRCGARA
jgi:hypothetical protein